MIKQGLPELNLPPRLLSQMQKVVMPSTCSIVRKLLSDEDSYLMRSLRTPNNVILLHIRSYISHFKIPCHTLYISFQNTLPYLIYLISKYRAIPSQQMFGPMTRNLGAQ